MNWPVMPLSALTSKIGSGATPRGGATVYVDSGALLIRSQNVLDNALALDGAARISADAARSLAGVAVQRGDVLINITGDSIARVALVNREIGPARVNQHVAIIRPNSLVDGGYLQKCLSSPATKDRLLNLSQGGATRKALTKAQLAQFQVRVPPLHIQQAIAQVLGALDDKIAANAKVAFASGELAQHIFQSAAGHAVTRRTYDEVADVAGGGTPSTREPAYWGGDVLWATPTDVTGLSSPYLDQTSRMITEEGLERCASALHPAGSILMTSRATIGAFALAKRPVAVNQGFIVVQAKNSAHQSWLFHEMQTRVTDYLAHANGATFLELSRGRFKTLQLDWPGDGAVMRKFAERVAPLHDRAYQAMLENRELVTLRDTLLPHLMSGRLTVRLEEALVSATA